MDKKSLAYLHRIQNEKPILSLDMLSDIHVTLPRRHPHLAHALDDMKERNVSTLAILGDISNNGYAFQLKACLTLLQAYSFRYLIPLGNHDTYNTFQHNQIHIHPLYKTLVLNNHHRLYFDEWICGIHFYILNTQVPVKTSAFYGNDQLDWLASALQKDDPTKPVIVLCHHPLSFTHAHTNVKGLSIGPQDNEVKRILKKHPRVIFFSGHVHNSYSLCDAIKEDFAFCVDVPSFSMIQNGIKRKYCGYVIQIYHDFLYIRTRDYTNNAWILSNAYIIDLQKHEVHLLPALLPR